MAKFRPVRKKGKRPGAPAGGVPCIILIAAMMALFLLFMIFVMKSSGT